MTSYPVIPSTLASLLTATPVPQGTFPWHRDPWQREMHDLPGVLAVVDRLPTRVDRDSTRRVVLQELQAGRVLPAFVCVMIWGYGTIGVGPMRTRWVLTGVGNRGASQEPILSTVEEHLEAGMQTVRNQGPREAFWLMNNEGGIKNLGPAYFTKWLYFVSALNGPDDPNAAPVLDKQVAGWLKNHAEISLNVNSTNSYAEYLDLLAAWGTEHERSRVQVEKAIFGLATGRG